MEDNSFKFSSLESNDSDANVKSDETEWVATMNCNNKIITDPRELFKELNKRESKRFFEVAMKCQDDKLLSTETDPFNSTTEIDFPEEAFQKDLELLTLRKFEINNCPTPIAQVASMTSDQDPEEFSTANLSAIEKPKQSYTEAPPDTECFSIVREIGNLLLKLQERQVRNMQLKEDSLLDSNEEAAQYEVPSNEYYMVTVHRSETDGSLKKCVLQALPFLKVLDTTKSALVWTPGTGQECRPSLLRQPNQSMAKQRELRIPTRSIIDIHLPSPGNNNFNLITPPITSPDLLPIQKNSKNQNTSNSSCAIKASSAITIKAPMNERSLSFSKLTYSRRLH